jgi:hypothetical protein
MAVRPEVAGAASGSLLALLTGPPRSAAVLARFDRALYLSIAARPDVGGSSHRDEVLAVVDAAALRLPCSVVLAASAGSELPAMVSRAGDAAIVVGGGRVELPAATIRVTRWWQPTTPRPAQLGARLLRQLDAVQTLVPRLPAEVGAASRSLAAEADAALSRAGPAPELAAAARRLVGLGPGLTPAGDDVLAALLVTLSAGPAAARAAAGDVAAAVLPDAGARTTALSAALLRHAAGGEGLPELVNLVDAVSAPGVQDDVTRLLRAVLAVGSSSGCAMVHGVLTGMRAMLAMSGRRWRDVEVA